MLVIASLNEKFIYLHISTSVHVNFMFLIVNINSSKTSQKKKTFIYFVCILHFFFRAFASMAYAYNKYNSTLVIVNKMIEKNGILFLREHSSFL